MIDSTHRRIAVYGLAGADGAVLLVRVAPPDRAAGRWTLPGGGMTWGEHPLATLRRELEEETGLVPDLAVPVLIRSGVLGPPEESSHPIHDIQIVYRVEVDGEPHPEKGGSTDDARWIPLDELGSLDLAPLVAEAVRLI